MRERTGQVWNKRFKRRHGAMLPFILDNLHIFTVTEAEEIGLTPAALACSLGETKSISRDIVTEEDGGVEVAATAEGATAGEAWFNVNDSQVTCVTDKALTEQYSGRECAYMLFYVRRTFLKDTRDTIPEPPAWLKAAVDSENAALQEQRRTYDEVAHRVKLYVVSAGAFTVETNVLKPKMEEDLAQEFGLAGVGGKDGTASSRARTPETLTATSQRRQRHEYLLPDGLH
jgi:ubiquitin carboxyl-terminal hydrolase 40